MSYNKGMKGIVQARLDEDSQKTLTRLVRELGWTPSEVVREGLRLLAASRPSVYRPRIVGLGRFASGEPDRGSNRKHLEGYGR
jgi:hypothetical protein